jgi:hypothetical protein
MSKEVKFMSKRVMRVMMIGLAAMLGAEAEAHYTIRFGKLYYCSVGCVAKVTDVNPGKPGEAQCVVTIPARGADISCEDENGVQREVQTEGMTLVAQEPIKGDISSNTAEVVIMVSDAPLTKACPKLKIKDMRIHTIESAQINIFDSAKVLASTAIFTNCKLPDTNPIDYPPTCGTFYVCEKVEYQHPK